MKIKGVICVSLVSLTVLVLRVLLIALQSPALAFSGLDEGATNSSYRITTCSQLDQMRFSTSAKYVLTGNIDCTDTVDWDSGRGWLPFEFYGLLDERNFTIDGLTVSRTDSSLGLLVPQAVQLSRI